MPNWAKGNIRIRGKKADIIATLKDMLEPTKCGSEKWTVMYYEGYGEVCFSAIDDNGIGIKYGGFPIKNTERNFINLYGGAHIIVNMDYDDENVHTVCIPNFFAAWSVKAEPYVDYSKRHNVDIKIVTYECGYTTIQRIEIIRGSIVKDECDHMGPDRWEWECDFPYMGG